MPKCFKIKDSFSNFFYFGLDQAASDHGRNQTTDLSIDLIFQ